MGNIKIIKGVFDTKLELEHAEVAAGFPINIDYSHETLDFNHDYIKLRVAISPQNIWWTRLFTLPLPNKCTREDYLIALKRSMEIIRL